MRMITAFPNEILNNILELAGAGERTPKTLLALCIVNQQLSGIAHNILYRNIKIRWTYRRGRQIIDHMSHQTHLATSVRSVSVSYPRLADSSVSSEVLNNYRAAAEDEAWNAHAYSQRLKPVDRRRKGRRTRYLLKNEEEVLRRVRIKVFQQATSLENGAWLDEGPEGERPRTAGVIALFQWLSSLTTLTRVEFQGVDWGTSCDVSELHPYTLPSLPRVQSVVVHELKGTRPCFQLVHHLPQLVPNLDHLEIRAREHNHLPLPPIVIPFPHFRPLTTLCLPNCIGTSWYAGLIATTSPLNVTISKKSWTRGDQLANQLVLAEALSGSRGLQSLVLAPPRFSKRNPGDWILPSTTLDFISKSTTLTHLEIACDAETILVALPESIETLKIWQINDATMNPRGDRWREIFLTAAIYLKAGRCPALKKIELVYAGEDAVRQHQNRFTVYEALSIQRAAAVGLEFVIRLDVRMRAVVPPGDETDL